MSMEELSSGLECRSNDETDKHFYCHECFEDMVKNQISNEYRGKFKEHDSHIVCALCLDLAQETRFEDREVFMCCGGETAEMYRKTCDIVAREQGRSEGLVEVQPRIDAMQEEILRISNDRARRVSIHRQHIVDMILPLTCPGCRVAIMGPADAHECFAMKCDNCNPKSFFCGWCLELCGDNKICHDHVRDCSINVKYRGTVFTGDEHPASVFFDTHKERRLTEIRSYIDSNVVSLEDQQAVKDAIHRDLQDVLGEYRL
jgi:hypothetical protein